MALRPYQAGQVAKLTLQSPLNAANLIEGPLSGVINADGSTSLQVVLPATSVISGTVAVSNFPASQTISGSVAVSNFPANQIISGNIGFKTNSVSGTLTPSATAYAANQVVTSGFLTFANALTSILSGELMSIVALSKEAQELNYSRLTVHLLSSAPSTVLTDQTALTLNAADILNYIGAFPLTNPRSAAGAMTSWRSDNIRASLSSSSTSLFGIVTVDTPITFTGTFLRITLGVRAD